MMDINPVDSVNIRNYGVNSRQKQVFAGSTLQTDTISNVTPDYSIKTPIKYTKTGELNLPFDFKAHMYKLANGQRVVIVPKEGETVVKTYVNTGSMNEPDNVRGISHYIEHNLFNGSNGLEAGEFFDTVNKMGADTNASTGFAETNYYISSNLLGDEDLEKKIKIHASMLETPRFAIEMLEKEKGIVNSEINMILGYPDNIIANETLRKLYNINSTSADLIGGTTQNITNLTRENVLDYFNNNYYPANMVTVITGEVEPENTVQLVSKYFSAPNRVSQARKFENLKPIDKTIRQDIISDKATATDIMLGFNGPKACDIASQIHISALSELLTKKKTGRLSKELNPFNASSVLSLEKISSRPNDNMAVLISAKTTEDNSEKVLKVMFDQIYSIITNPLSDEELQTIKKSLLNAYSETFETSHDLNSLIGDFMLKGRPEGITDYEKIINSITKDDIVNAAKQYLDLNKTAVTVLHPQTASKESISNRYALSFTGSKQAIKADNVKRYIYPNNFEMVTNNSKTNKSIFQIHYNTEIPKDIKPAARAVLNGILNEGSIYKNAYQYQKELDKNGITMLIHSGQKTMTAAAIFNADDTEKAIKSAKEVLLHPRFTQETLDFVKNDIKEHLAKKEKNADDKLKKELLGNISAGATKEDILKDLDNITLEEVKDLYSYILNNSQGHFTISAPYNKRPELMNIINKEIGDLPDVKPAKPFLRDTYTPVTETKVLTDVDERNQADIIEAFKFKINGNLKDKTAISLLNIILGGNASSRLFNDLRERQQLAYRVNSSVKTYDNTGIFKLFIGTTTDNKATGEVSYNNVQKSIEGFNKHINKIKSEKVTDEELANAKLNLKNIILSDVETTAGKNDSLSVNITDLNGALADNEILKLVDTITADDIYNAANYIFSGKPTYSILATENTLKANEDYFKTL